jgi:hypothetical protein
MDYLHCGSRGLRRGWGRNWLAARALVGLSCSFSLGCGEATDDAGDGSDGTGPVGTSSTSYEVTGPCAIRATDEKELVPLTKAEFVELVADYAVDWLAPVHDALLEVNDEGVFRAFFEVILGAYNPSCRSETNYNVLNPDDSLLDPARREQSRSDLKEFLNSAVEVSSGEVLRLSFHECESCSEPVGESPSFWNIRKTQAGALLVEIELTEGAAWTKKVTIKPNEVAFQAELQPASDWAARSNESARNGTTTYPNLSGTLTAGLRRDDTGHMHGYYGVSGFSLVNHGVTTEEVLAISHNDCVGFEVNLGPSSEGSSWNAEVGDIDITMPGSSFCPQETSCGAKERTGPFEAQLGGLSLDLVQPPSSSSDVFTLHAATQNESTFSVAGDTYARGGLGDQGKGGQSLASVKETAEGFLVTFSPALDMGGALMISAFSEEMKMKLPDWLSDEIFDLSFGGDPLPSVLVPFREACPEGMYTEVPRRKFQVVSGELELEVGGGTLKASPGQCIGTSLEDPATFDQTSDFWDVGFVCSE